MAKLTLWASQDESGWSPLMISASVPDSEPILKLLIQRGADINLKSKTAAPRSDILQLMQTNLRSL